MADLLEDEIQVTLSFWGYLLAQHPCLLRACQCGNRFGLRLFQQAAACMLKFETSWYRRLFHMRWACFRRGFAEGVERPTLGAKEF